MADLFHGHGTENVLVKTLAAVNLLPFDFFLVSALVESRWFLSCMSRKLENITGVWLLSFLGEIR